MKVSPSSVYNKRSKLDDVYLSISNDIKKLTDCLNGRIRFGTATDSYNGQNMYGIFHVKADSGNADTEWTFTHNLGSVPIGFIVLSINKAGIVYKSKNFTTTEAYFKCSVANAAVTLFLIP